MRSRSGLVIGERAITHRWKSATLVCLLALVVGACAGTETADTSEPLATTEATPVTTAAPAATTTAPATTTTEAPDTSDDGGAYAVIDDSVVAAAESESGELIWYSSDSVEASETVLEAFQEEYPFVTDAQHIFYDAGEVAARIQQESQAGARTADVGSTSDAIVKSISSTGLVAATDWVALGMPEAVVPDEYMTLTMSNVPLIIYNSELVAPEDAPQQWDDLLDPKWKGQMALTTIPGPFAGLAAAYGPERIRAYFDQLIQQEPALMTFEGVAQAVGSGEFLVGATTYHQALPTVAAGAPIEFVIGDIAVLTNIYSFIPESAASPATGRLFTLWLNSEEGSRIVDEATGRGNALLPGNGTSALVEGAEQLSFFHPDDAAQFGEWLGELGEKLTSAAGG